MDMMMLGQALGVLSFVLGVSSFLQKDDKRLKQLMLLMNINHSIHFFLIGAMTSAVAVALGAGRTAMSLKTRSPWVAAFFVIALLAVSSQWAHAWYDWLAVAGASCGTIGLFCLSGIKMRLALLTGSLCWLTNNFIVGSIGGVLLESLAICVNLNTMFVLYKIERQSLANAAVAPTKPCTDC